jgi:hypothetical protein
MRKVIGALGLLVVAAIIAVGSGASFTAHSANPGNMVTAGAFSIANNHEGQALFAPQTNWDPGEEVLGYVNIGNSGTEAGNFTVKGIAEAGNDTEFSKNIQVQVTDYTTDPQGGGNATVRPGGMNFNGSLYNLVNGCTNSATAKMPDGTSPACEVTTTHNGTAWGLSNWATNETHYYRFRLINRAPDGNGNDPAVAAFFGKSAKFGIEWDAVSTA